MLVHARPLLFSISASRGWLGYGTWVSIAGRNHPNTWSLVHEPLDALRHDNTCVIETLLRADCSIMHCRCFSALCSRIHPSRAARFRGLPGAADIPVHKLKSPNASVKFLRIEP